MSINKLILTTFLFLVIFTVFQVFLVNSALAADEENGVRYATPPAYQLEVPLGNTTSVTGFNEYIKIVYRFAVGLIALIALFLIVLGGIIWILASGNEQSITKAKTMIMSAIIGLLLALSSYIILYTINPNLVSLEAMQIPYIEMYFGEGGAGLSLLEPCSGSDWGDECQQTPCGSTCMKSGEYCRGIICSDSSKPLCGPDISAPIDKQKCYSSSAEEILNQCDSLYWTKVKSKGIDSSDKDKANANKAFANCACSLAYNTDQINDVLVYWKTNYPGFECPTGGPADPYSYFYVLSYGTCDWGPHKIETDSKLDLQKPAEQYLTECGEPYYNYGISGADCDAACEATYDARVASATQICKKDCTENDTYGFEVCTWHEYTYSYEKDFAWQYITCPDGGDDCTGEYNVGFCVGPGYAEGEFYFYD